MIGADLLNAAGTPGPTAGARLYVASFALVLGFWTIVHMRRRTLLVPIGALCLGISIAAVSFSLFPTGFDALSRFVGVRYPPVFYISLATLALLILVIHLAVRLSAVSERCRRLAQEFALLHGTSSGQSTRVQTPSPDGEHQQARSTGQG